MATSKRERQKAARREKMARRDREMKRRRTVRRGVIFAVIAAAVVAAGAVLFSGGSTPTTTTTAATTTSTTSTTTTTIPAAVKAAQTDANAKAVSAGCPASPYTRVNALTWSKEPAITISKTQPLYAHVVTTAGDFVIHLLPDKALHTVNSFVFLAEHHFYNCVIFHRVVKNFVIQGGDPTGTGRGGPGYTLPDEYPKPASPQYPLFSVAMANETTPHTGGSQFFIVTGTAGEQLSASYSLFGQVVSGQAVILKINSEGSSLTSQTGAPVVVQRMLSVTISSTP